jgi:uncharacterized protein YaiI (UPF0178 family)
VSALIPVYVDADACPVKDEIYRVAARHGCLVKVVANAPIAVPREAWIERVVVAGDLDAADDWIAARAAPGCVVVTADIPLADRCVKAGAAVIAPNGRAHTAATIGLTLATRDLMTGLRSAGAVTSGPPPFSARDRSAFLSALDLALVRIKRAQAGR